MRFGENWPLAVPFALVAALALTFGAALLRRQIALWRRGIVVDAVVVDRKLHAGMPNPGFRTVATVTPRFYYRMPDGTEHIAELDHQARQRVRSENWRLRFPLDQHVRVRVDPGRPDIVYVGSHVATLVFPALLVCAGLLTGLIAFGIAFG